MPSCLAEAQRLVSAGLSLLPIAADGSKAPAAWLLPRDPQTDRPTWAPYQARQPTPEELHRWYASGNVGMALVAGVISGNLEILDFDVADLFAPWADLVEDLRPGLLTRLPVVQTPSNGRHVSYRCEGIQGNQKLAQRLDGSGHLDTLIETRGEGGYVLIPPSPLACHPDHKPYVILDGDLADIPTITPDERTILLNVARTFNEYVPPKRLVSAPSSGPRPQRLGERPGDAFNARATWREILEPHGWTCVGQRGEVTVWRRPGKKGRGCSATTNIGASGLFYVFSSNAHPFKPQTAYSKFTAYAFLEHQGDFRAAAKALADRGYGEHHRTQEVEPFSPPEVTNGTVPFPTTRARAAAPIRTIAASEVLSWRR